MGVVLLCLGAGACARHHVPLDVPLAPAPVPPPVVRPSLHPIPGPPALVTSEFGVPRASGRFHGGIDFGVPTGTPVRATASGTVSFAGNMGGYGLIVIVYHTAETETRYAHLSRILVERGAHVEQGQLLGHSGATGNATGPHLHYEVRLSGIPVEPRAFFPQHDAALAQNVLGEGEPHP